MPHLFLQKVTFFIFFFPPGSEIDLWLCCLLKLGYWQKHVNIIDGIYAFHLFKLHGELKNFQSYVLKDCSHADFLKQCRTSPTTAPKNRT